MAGQLMGLDEFAGGPAGPSAPARRLPSEGILPGKLTITGSTTGIRPFSPGEFIANPDGSWSNEITDISEDPRLNAGKPTVVPTLWLVNGKPVRVSVDQAARYAAQSGLDFPAFADMQSAQKFARQREANWQNIRPQDSVKVQPLGRTRVMSADDFASGGQPAPAVNASTLDKGIQRMKNLGGEAASIADFFLGIPGFILGTGASLGRAAILAGHDITGHETRTSKQIFQEAQQFGQGVAEPFSSPVHKLIAMFGDDKEYQNALTTQGLEKATNLINEAGQWVEKQTSGHVPAEAVGMLANTLMTAAPGLAKGKSPALETLGDFKAGKTAPTAEPAPTEPSAPRDVAADVNEMLGISTPAEQAAARKTRLKDIKAAFKTPEPGGDYGSVEESQFRADERMQNEAAYRAAEERRAAAENAAATSEVNTPAAPETPWSDALRAYKKQPWERTAEDLIRLRAFEKQHGEASPELLKWMAAGGVGATVGAFADQDQPLRGAGIGLGVLAAMGLTPAALSRMAEVQGPLAQMGAVKPKGGMWHPEAVERLAGPLKDRLAGGGHRIVEGITPLDVAARVAPLNAWTDRAVRNYLNRHAGTEGDPLKDVQIPHGVNQETVSWGDVFDRVIKAEQQQGPRGLETAYNVTHEGQGVRAQNQLTSLRSYLSHVGDYLRQNVDPAKLPQYDLVRAVKETSKWDEAMAKAMEAEHQGDLASMPVHKVYPDGYKWVELKLPEKLDPEQARGVRPATEWGKDALGGAVRPDARYVAVDASGKPIKTADGYAASGATPEEAWLSGQLAKEGNAMGHCVGGYCEAVASGESRIYSLRDPQGRSHVTVEINPFPRRPGDYSVMSDSDVTPDILQIKGKQNRAPVAQYLPYVQDFVKSGKWGEVGDLENTGLIRTQEGKFATEDELRAAGEAQPRPGRERGSIDRDLLLKLGAASAGAATGAALSDDETSGTILGGLAGFGLPLAARALRPTLAELAKGADVGLGLISTRLRNLDPALAKRARDFEMRTLRDTHQYIKRVAPFVTALNKLPAADQGPINRALLNGDSAQLQILLRQHPDLAQAYPEVRKVLGDLSAKLRGEGRFRQERAEYYPRIVKDYDGLMEALGSETRTYIEKELDTAERAAIRRGEKGLSDIEASRIINEALARRKPASGKPGFAKARTITEVTPELEKFYATPTESLHSYLRNATQDLEKARFFGRDLVNVERDGGTYINTDASIGNVVRRAVDEGRMSREDIKTLESMLNARFNPQGQTSPLVQDIKSLGYAGLLGNIVSAATQLGDVGTAIYAQGLRPALQSVIEKLTGRMGVDMRDFGLQDHISEEFVSTRKAAEFLNKTMKYAGFSAIDKFGKDVALNAALHRYQALAQSPKGIEQIARKYGEAYGPDFNQLVDDLKAKRMSEPVQSLLFSELSDVQPISKLELPQKYLEMPNGRIVYMLKTFMLKQLDIARRDAYNEIKKGGVQNIARGVTNLTRYGLVLGISGATTQAVQDWLMGKDAHLTAGDVLSQALKTFGWSQYVLDKAASGHPAEAVAGALAPPYKMIDSIVSRDPQAIRYIPVIGTLYYMFQGGAPHRKEVLRERAQERRSDPAEIQRRMEARVQRIMEGR